jgi:transposase
VPAVPSSIIEPIWTQFRELIPPVIDAHPLGCHRRRIPDRVVFDKLVQVLVLGAAYAKIADGSCSATTLRHRRDEWIDAGTERRIRVIDAFIALANAIIIVRRLLRDGWTRYRWDGRPTRKP